VAMTFIFITAVLTVFATLLGDILYTIVRPAHQVFVRGLATATSDVTVTQFCWSTSMNDHLPDRLR